MSVNTEPDTETAAAMQLRQLEDDRFDAILSNDLERFAELCHPSLSYTHSNGARDTLDSYVEKVRNGHYVYQRIAHPIDSIVITGDTALVVGSMDADLLVGGRQTHLENVSTAVWTRANGTWKLLAYAPTPTPARSAAAPAAASDGEKEAALTAEVLESFARTADPRVHEIFTSVVTHLHALVRDLKPTIEEWGAAIDFLTKTGHTSTDVRQEFILLSDVLGVSMLVETINDEETPDATESTVLGPFHVVESPPRAIGDNISPQSPGPVCVVRGRVLSGDGTPIVGATVDIWQANAEGFYDVQEPETQDVGNGRGLLMTDSEGRFRFRSVIPHYYPIPTDGPVGVLLDAARRHPNRPAHIHFLVSAPGFKTLTTHIFVEGSEYIESDAVFAVKQSLMIPFRTNTDADIAAEWGVESPFEEASIDIRLHPDGVDDVSP